MGAEPHNSAQIAPGDGDSSKKEHTHHEDVEKDAAVMDRDLKPQNVEDAMQLDEERAPEARGKDSSEIRSTYWISPQFLGSYLAVGVLYMCSCAGFSYTAPLLSYINADVGPSQSIQYAPIANSVASACAVMIIGRLSDIFGRRWFFIVGCLIGLVGSIIMATAQNVVAVIIANIFFGIELGFGVSYFWVVGEMVPMRWRLIANSGPLVMTFPGNPLGAKVAVAFQNGNSLHWRSAFYFLIAANALATLLFFFFYHPPTFKMLHRRKVARDLLIHFDWIGLCLYSLGVILLILGLSWGGSIYPWASGHVIGGIVGGVVCFILVGFWEVYLPFPDSEPLIPIYLFKNLPFQAATWLTGIGASCWYGYSLVWPNIVRTLYTDVTGSEQSTLFSAVILAFVLGEITGGFVGTVIGPKIGIISSMYIAVPLLCASASNPQNKDLTLGLIITGSLFVGIMEGQAFTVTTFPLRSQKEIGTAGGLSGTIRNFVSALGVAVYTTVQNNRLGTTIPKYVSPAAIDAGLPQSSVPALISGLQGLTDLTPQAVPGLNDAILSLSREAFKLANAKAYSTVLYVTMAFAGPGLLLVWFVPSRNREKDAFVASHIHRAADERALEQE